jgi:hypothetical protein
MGIIPRSRSGKVACTIWQAYASRYCDEKESNVGYEKLTRETTLGDGPACLSLHPDSFDRRRVTASAVCGYTFASGHRIRTLRTVTIGDMLRLLRYDLQSAICYDFSL